MKFSITSSLIPLLLCHTLHFSTCHPSSSISSSSTTTIPHDDTTSATLSKILSSISNSTFNHRRRRRRMEGDDNNKSKNKHKNKKQKNIKFYRYFDWKDMHQIMLELAEAYPSLVTLQNAQDVYNLPAAGGTNDCPTDDDFDRRVRRLRETYYTMGKNKQQQRHLFDNTPGCKNWFLTISDSEAHTPTSPSTSQLPTILFVGAMHGNDNIGSTAMLEMAALLLEASHCESLPHDNYPGDDAADILKDSWMAEFDVAKSCRKALEDRGLTDDERRWLARLVTTRRIILSPATNALGCFRNVADEEGWDPTIDFPFGRNETDVHPCMQTVAARTVNEIYRHNLIQMAVSFESGYPSVSFPWGTPAYKVPNATVVSPDDVSQSQIAESMAIFGGVLPRWANAQSKLLIVGNTNDIVGSKYGNMPDWAYGGSLDPSQLTTCNPLTYAGYDASLTTYDDAILRSYHVSIRTSPDADKRKAGSDYDLFDPDMNKKSDANKPLHGYIPRNIRAGLMMLDVVQPYLSIRNIGRKEVTDDIVPLKRRDERSAMVTKLFNVPTRKRKMTWPVTWIVGGGLTVDKTGVLYAKWEHLPEEYDGENQPEGATYDFLTGIIQQGENNDDPKVRVSALRDGKTRWHEKGPFPKPPKEASGLAMAPTFTAKINLNDYLIGDQIAVIAFGVVDESWSESPDRGDKIMPHDVPPQSHLANARTNRQWKKSVDGQEVQGRLYWFSTPLTISIGPENVRLFEMSMRMPKKVKRIVQLEKKLAQGIKDIPEEVEEHPLVSSLTVTLALVALVGLLGYKKYQKNRRDAVFKEIRTEIDGMEMNEQDDYAHVTRITNHTID